jgi:hypothetical protein
MIALLTQVAAWRGAASIGAVGSETLNGTAEDIGSIAGITIAADSAVIVIGMRRENWTAVATLSGDGLTWAEIGEPVSDAGGESIAGTGLVWNYAIATGGTTVTDTRPR